MLFPGSLHFWNPSVLTFLSSPLLSYVFLVDPPSWNTSLPLFYKVCAHFLKLLCFQFTPIDNLFLKQLHWDIIPHHTIYPMRKVLLTGFGLFRIYFKALLHSNWEHFDRHPSYTSQSPNVTAHFSPLSPSPGKLAYFMSLCTLEHFT